MIRTIEELSMNAWPAMQSLHYDGWVLRFAEGYTKRANSVHPLYDSKMDVDKKIEFCESFYRDQGLPTIFKMTLASTPSNLDACLAERGYQIDSPCSVQLLDMGSKKPEVWEGVELTSLDTGTWHKAFARMNNVSVENSAKHESLLRAILLDKCYASISVNEDIIACGLAVLQAGYLGIFDIVIDTDQRGQRYGTHLMDALLALGQKHGAHTSYLQVMCDNEPALGLYKKLGFQEKYQYWYRIQPKTS